MISPRSFRLRVGAAAMLAVTLALVSAPSATLGAGPACRVRNVTQATSGNSLIRMVEQAEDGDRLRVRGTCRGEVVVEADVVIRGMGDRTTLTGLGQRRVVRVKAGAHASLHHLTIEHGYTESRAGGAGIHNGGVLKIMDSLVRRNRVSGASGGGGGISAGVGARTTLRRVIVARNLGWSGGGIYDEGVRMRLVDSVVRDNQAKGGRASSDGGGIVSYQGALELVGSTVRGNSSVGQAGGIHSGAMTLVRSVVRDNRAASEGGGIVGDEGTIEVVDSAIRRNASGWQGGGISLWGDVNLTRSVIAGNTARRGGGIADHADSEVGSGEIVLTDSTIRRNRASGKGGGIWLFSPGHGTVVLDADSRVTGNTPDQCAGTTAC